MFSRTLLLCLLLSCAAPQLAPDDSTPWPRSECTAMRDAANKEVDACKAFCEVGDDDCSRENCFVRAIVTWKCVRNRCEHVYPRLYYPNPPWPTVGKPSKDDDDY